MTNQYTLKNGSLEKPHPKKGKLISYPLEFIEEIDRIHYIIKNSPNNHQIPFINLIPCPFSAGDEIALRYFAFDQLLILTKQLIEQYVPACDKKYFLVQLPQSPIQHLEKL